MSELCGRGQHPMAGDNVYRNPTTGKVYCRACKMAWQDDWRARNPRRSPGRPRRQPINPSVVAALRAAHQREGLPS